METYILTATVEVDGVSRPAYARIAAELLAESLEGHHRDGSGELGAYTATVKGASVRAKKTRQAKAKPKDKKAA